METLELKKSLHQLIDELDNPSLIELLHDFLSTREENQNGKLWESLSEDQKKEVLLAAEESENPEKLIPHLDIIKKLK